MNSLGHYVKEITGNLNEFPGLMRRHYDTTGCTASRLVKRASARIYIGGSNYYRDFITSLARSENKKPIRERGLGFLFVDNKSMKKINKTEIDGQPLDKKLEEIGVELITIKSLLSFYHEKRKSVTDTSAIFSKIDKIKFTSSANLQDINLAAQQIEYNLKKLLRSEVYKSLIPWYVCENYNVDVVAVMDLDTKAPLVPQNMDSYLLDFRKPLTLSLFLKSKYNDKGTPANAGSLHIIDSELFPLILDNPEPVDFQTEYSFFEVAKDFAGHYSNSINHCFWNDVYKDMRFSIQESDGDNYRIKSADDIKHSEFNALKVKRLKLATNDTNGKEYVYSHSVDNKVSLYKFILGQYNICIREARINEMALELKIHDYEDKITVCKDIFAGDIRTIQPKDHCNQLLTNSDNKMKISIDSNVIVVAEHNHLKDLSAVVSAPCSQWNDAYTVTHRKWIHNLNSPNVTVPCLGKENFSFEQGVNHEAIPLTKEQPINHRLLPPEVAPDYFMNFANGVTCGALSYLMDEVADGTLLCRCPKVRPVYRFSRNVLFGGWVFGSLQTVLSHISHRRFPPESGQCPTVSWKQSVIKFCLNNALLLVPVTQGAVIPALFSTAGSMISQVGLQSIMQRMRSNPEKKTD